MVIGFWKRFLSDILDTIFLGIFGLCLIFPLRLIFPDMGENGAWLGLIISFLYAGLLQSSLGEGQSLAKRVLRIQVVQLNGKFLSLPKSFLRYSVIALIAYNPVFGAILGSFFPDSQWLDGFYICFIIVLFLGCLVMVPIHPLKRGIHDILAGSIVVQKGTYKAKLKKVEKKEKDRVRWAYGAWAASSLVVLLIGGLSLSRIAANTNSMYDISAVQEAVVQATAFQNVNVQVKTFTVSPFSGQSQTTVSLVVSGYLKPSLTADPDTKEKEVEKAVEQVLAHYPHLDKMNKIVIVTRSGINIGIANFNENVSEEFGTDGKKLDK